MGQCTSTPVLAGETEEEYRARYGTGINVLEGTRYDASTPQPVQNYTTTVCVGYIVIIIDSSMKICAMMSHCFS